MTALERAGHLAHSRSAAFRARVERARGRISEAFDAEPDGMVSVSWGKDSVATLALVADARPDARAVFLTTEHQERIGDFARVEAEGLALFPAVRYERVPVGTEVHGRFARSRPPMSPLVFIGLRIEESARRRVSLRTYGHLHRYRSGPLVGQWRCCPLLDWSERDVWALHVARGLPWLRNYDEGETRTSNTLKPDWRSPEMLARIAHARSHNPRLLRLAPRVRPRARGGVGRVIVTDHALQHYRDRVARRRMGLADAARALDAAILSPEFRAPSRDRSEVWGLTGPDGPFCGVVAGGALITVGPGWMFPRECAQAQGPVGASAGGFAAEAGPTGEDAPRAVVPARLHGHLRRYAGGRRTGMVVRAVLRDGAGVCAYDPVALDGVLAFAVDMESRAGERGPVEGAPDPTPLPLACLARSPEGWPLWAASCLHPAGPEARDSEILHKRPPSGRWTRGPKGRPALDGHPRRAVHGHGDAPSPRALRRLGRARARRSRGGPAPSGTGRVGGQEAVAALGRGRAVGGRGGGPASGGLRVGRGTAAPRAPGVGLGGERPPDGRSALAPRRLHAAVLASLAPGAGMAVRGEGRVAGRTGLFRVPPKKSRRRQPFSILCGINRCSRFGAANSPAK